jgi:DNA ligase-1
MRDFARLIDSLTFTRSRTAKLRLIGDYLRSAPDPDRGWAMAALTENLELPTVRPAAVRALVEERVDPALFRMSRDYVGDTAETVALLWPEPGPKDYEVPLSLGQVIEQLRSSKRGVGPQLLALMLDRLPADDRYALLKLATGALRVGVSGRLARTAFAAAFTLNADAVEELWHGLLPPYSTLFAWAEGRAAPPEIAGTPKFRPFMLAHPLDEGTTISLDEFVAEWKWDGIRVQVARFGTETRIYSRGGDEISGAFPEIAAAFVIDGAVDGELLVRGTTQGGPAGGAASFNALQKRLGRKQVSAAMLREYPAFVRLYDLLALAETDMRNLSWTERRLRLEALMPSLPNQYFDISTIVSAAGFAELRQIQSEARESAVEGLMLKRRDSPYVSGRRVGLWYKWKREPLIADCVLMYAQRGSGKRSSYFSDYTFGCWNGDPAAGAELLPVGKAYSGFSDTELKWIDKFVREQSIGRFGPVTEVEKSLVFEVAFDSIHLSKRHKSGLAMRFPRISRLRRDKPAEEADRVATLAAMVERREA